VAKLVRLPASRAQQALARYRDEERAFRIVLEVLKEWRREKLFIPLFTVYRARMQMLRRLAGALLADVEPSSASEELRGFSRKSDR